MKVQEEERGWCKIATLIPTFERKKYFLYFSKMLRSKNIIRFVADINISKYFFCYFKSSASSNITWDHIFPLRQWFSEYCVYPYCTSQKIMDKIWFYIFCIQIFAGRLAYLFLTRNHYLHLYKVFQKLYEGNSIKLKIIFFWKATVRVNDILDALKL